MDTLDPEITGSIGHEPVQAHHWSAVLHEHLYIKQGRSLSDSPANCLETRLLGRKPRRQRPNPVDARTLQTLLIGEHTAFKVVAVAANGAFNSARFNNVDSDA